MVPVLWALLCLIPLIAPLGSAGASPNVVAYSNGVDAPVLVVDAGLLDFDSDPDEIRANFSVSDPFPPVDWVATGVIIATTTNPAGATLVVTNTTITDTSGEQINGDLVVEHIIDPFVSLTASYQAHLFGEFDKIGGGVLGDLTLIYSAYLNSVVLISDNIPVVQGGLVFAPEDFDEISPPEHLDTVIRQTHRFRFYMDGLNDFIHLPSSASIAPAAAPVPVLGEALLLVLLATIVAVMIWRAQFRRSTTTRRSRARDAPT